MLSNRTENYKGRYPDSLPNIPQALGTALAQNPSYYQKFNSLEMDDKLKAVNYINAAQNRQETDERIGYVLSGFR